MPVIDASVPVPPNRGLPSAGPPATSGSARAAVAAGVPETMAGNAPAAAAKTPAAAITDRTESSTDIPKSSQPVSGIVATAAAHRNQSSDRPAFRPLERSSQVSLARAAKPVGGLSRPQVQIPGAEPAPSVFDTHDCPRTPRSMDEPSDNVRHLGKADHSRRQSDVQQMRRDAVGLCRFVIPSRQLLLCATRSAEGSRQPICSARATMMPAGPRR